jgi:hypothetical protein
MTLSVLVSTVPSLAQQGGLGVFRTRTSVTKLKEHPAKPKDAPIDVLASPPRDRDYEDLCMINAKGGQTIFNAKTSGDLIEAMKKDARKCGADAIILGSTEDRSWRPFDQGLTQAKSTVLAIRYLEDLREN